MITLALPDTSPNTRPSPGEKKERTQSGLDPIFKKQQQAFGRKGDGRGGEEKTFKKCPSSFPQKKG